MSPTPELDHNVYILGAGFSRDGGLPLIDDFLQRMGDSLDSNTTRPHERDAIQRVFEFRLSAAAASYRAKVNVENIEELFSLASAAAGEELNVNITTAIAATLRFAHSVALPVSCRCETFLVHPEGHRNLERARDGLSLYALYAEVLNGNFVRDPTRTKNSIITFNYDTLLEEGFAAAKIPFTYGFAADSVEYQSSAKCVQQNQTEAIPIYKLHGSINWGLNVSAPDRVKVYGAYEEIDAGQRILLLPPTWQKVFGGQLNAVLAKAVEALNQATRIVIIGFSMPPTDIHFKFLLAAGMQKNISLRKLFFVNPGLNELSEKQRLEENLFRILRLELKDQGVIQLINADTKTFLLGNAGRRQINRSDPQKETIITTNSNGIRFNVT